MKPQYLRVRNWEKFQHYKNRNPPWIRLHRTLLRDHKFHQLTEVQQWQLVRIWLLASECENHLAWDEKWIRRAIQSSRKVDLDALLELGFLEPSVEKSLPPRSREASDVLAEREQDAEPEADSSDSSDSSRQSFTPQAAKQHRPCSQCGVGGGLHVADCPSLEVAA